MEERIIRIVLRKKKGSDLLMALSPDLEGLVVHGYSESEIEKKLPNAIKDVLEMSGIEVISVTAARDDDDAVFDAPAFIASACLGKTNHSHQ